MMLSPKVIKEYPSIRDKQLVSRPSDKQVEKMKQDLLWLSCTQRYSQIPFDNDQLFDGFIILPKSQAASKLWDLYENLLRCKDKLDELILFSFDTNIQDKYQKTIQMINHFTELLRVLHEQTRAESLFQIDIQMLYRNLSQYLQKR